MLSRLNPKKIVVVSSAPQIRYPDCYGIDMARLQDFIAFRAAIDLLKENGKEGIIKQVYEKCHSQVDFKDKDVKIMCRKFMIPLPMRRFLQNCVLT